MANDHSLDHSLEPILDHILDPFWAGSGRRLQYFLGCNLLPEPEESACYFTAHLKSHRLH